MKRKIDKSEVIKEKKEPKTETKPSPSDSKHKQELPLEFKPAIKFVPPQLRSRNLHH
ncbi:hypothetical protein TOT_020000884 [Theileria orientalis strain Shintoku]|uniref:Uncharacterized protein n=1 Tax=Theileria orientalis strain Shintoku TaxID=869250 RepID=J4D882_THEOR|nr:hypothetical protein TOT_020000884 [Theileria orientalis strain Shintoku]BAM40630.1 hypothetical protein TOT_020000884 [Theileria orientalis strain Shintoku]|eukprot:XP_009690931.1 hypothetical protein TOT_020000884 [Theileria orientalis strain Shintoku]